MSEFDTRTIKFSPLEELKLVSCGKENIRFWRLKQKHLKGSCVVLNHYARTNSFTCLDFDLHCEKPEILSNNKVIVGSSQGLIFIVGYCTRQLLQVLKIHSAEITDIRVATGFCVTGSADEFVRVWPLDFSEFHLEAKHEGTISALDIAFDGVRIAVGT